MDCSTPGLPVHHQLLEFIKTYVHWAGDAMKPSHLLSPPSSPTFNLSPNQGLFQWVSSLHQMPKVLEFQLQHQFLQWIFRTDFLWDGLVGSPCSPRDSQESSPIDVQKHQFFWCSAFFIVHLSHPYMTTGKTIPLTRQTFVGKVMSMLINLWPKLWPITIVLGIYKNELKYMFRVLPGCPVVKNLPANAGDTGLISGLRRFHMPWGN